MAADGAKRISENTDILSFYTFSISFVVYGCEDKTYTIVFMLIETNICEDTLERKRGISHSYLPISLATKHENQAPCIIS